MKLLFANSKHFSYIFFWVILSVGLGSAYGSPNITVSSIGGVLDQGSGQISVNEFKLAASAGNLNTTKDSLLFAHCGMNGNFDCAFTVKDRIGSYGTIDAGIMIRSDKHSESPFIALITSQSQGLIVYYRGFRSEQTQRIVVSSTTRDCLRVKRTGNTFTFQYKNAIDPQSTTSNVSYELSLPSSILIGPCLIVESPALTGSVIFTDFTGFPISATPDCQPVLYDFNRHHRLDSLGFSQNLWVHDSVNENFKSNVYDSSTSYFKIPPFTTTRGDNVVNFTWKSLIDRDSLPDLQEFVLFGSNSVTVRDRANIHGGWTVGSNGCIDIGCDDTIRSNIKSRSNVILRDRAQVMGDVFAGGCLIRQNNTNVSGRIVTGTHVLTPQIPLRNVTTGCYDINVNSNTTYSLNPGNYNTVHVYSNATLILKDGIYNFNRFIIETDVRVNINLCSSRAIQLNALCQLNIGDRSCVNICGGGPEALTIYSNQSCSIVLGTDISVPGFIYAPHAQVTVSSRSTLIGGLFAKSIIVESGARVSSGNRNITNDRINFNIVSTDTNHSYKLLWQPVQIQKGIQNGSIALKYDDTIIQQIPVIYKVPFRKWVRWKAEFARALAITDSGSIAVSIDTGTGYSQLLRAYNKKIQSFGGISTSYKKGNDSHDRQLRIDDIGISCVTAPCKNIEINSQPKDTAVYVGARVTFTLHTNGKTEQYQWYRNGVPIPGATFSECILNSVTLSDNASQFWCKVRNECDTICSRIAILHVTTCLDPVIINQPKSDTVDNGEPAFFSVDASGLDLQYQWYRNDEIIEGETKFSLGLTSVKTLNNGDEFWARILNSCGRFILSNKAILTVNTFGPCGIASEPKSDTIEVGDYFTPEIAVRCDSARFTWYVNDSLLTYSHDRALIYGPVDLSQSGFTYHCVVTNGHLSDTSLSAQLTVVPKKNGNRIVAISGDLFEGDGQKVGDNSTIMQEFKVLLYKEKAGGHPVYQEEFSGKKRVPVINGQFTIHLGKGKSNGDLQKISAFNKDLYAEIFIVKNGYSEILGSRIPFTAAPYAYSSPISVMYGNGNPTDSEISQGTLYVNTSDNNKTWIKVNNGWKCLE